MLFNSITDNQNTSDFCPKVNKYSSWSNKQDLQSNIARMNRQTITSSHYMQSLALLHYHFYNQNQSSLLNEKLQSEVISGNNIKIKDSISEQISYNSFQNKFELDKIFKTNSSLNENHSYNDQLCLSESLDYPITKSSSNTLSSNNFSLIPIEVSAKEQLVRNESILQNTFNVTTSNIQTNSNTLLKKNVILNTSDKIKSQKHPYLKFSMDSILEKTACKKAENKKVPMSFISTPSSLNHEYSYQSTLNSKNKKIMCLGYFLFVFLVKF